MNGGTSGHGSEGKLLEFKAMAINDFIQEKQITSLIDFGCGDGRLANRLKINWYFGYDVSSEALLQCRRDAKGKTFFCIDEYAGESADLALSVDVILHLVEDDVFETYMAKLFKAADKYVMIYSSNLDDNTGMSEHVRHRKVVEWIANTFPDWELFRHIKNPYSYFDGDPNGSFCDFYLYKKTEEKE